MTKISSLKRARLLAHMTQMAVAGDLGVSQSTYQRWEAGTLPVPEKKVAQIAKLFGTSHTAVLGTPQPFDLFGVSRSIGDDRKYYGEVAIHFKSGGEPLLLSITEASHGRFYGDLHQDDPFVKVEGLDNRMVFVRREAVSDVYFSSEAYDDYGPEADRYQEPVGIFPDDDFWCVAEVFDELSDFEDEFDPEVLASAKAKLTLTDAELDGLIAAGHVKPEEREKVRCEADEQTKELIARARNVSWQIGSCRRDEPAPDGKELYEQFWWLEEDAAAHERMLFLVTEGYHRTIVINLGALDYICIPAHKFREGQLEDAETALEGA